MNYNQQSTMNYNKQQSTMNYNQIINNKVL